MPTFVRVSSIGQNASAEKAMQDLDALFQVVDKDNSGGIDEQEMHKLIKKLNIFLSDPVEDVRSLFTIMDVMRTGSISAPAFRAVFEDDITSRASMYGTIDLDDIVKNKLNQMLTETRTQRMHVIRAFMDAGRIRSAKMDRPQPPRINADLLRCMCHLSR